MQTPTHRLNSGRTRRIRAGLYECITDRMAIRAALLPADSMSRQGVLADIPVA